VKNHNERQVKPSGTRKSKDKNLSSRFISEEELTIIQGFEVSNELDIFIHRGLFGVNCPSKHVATELQLILC